MVKFLPCFHFDFLESSSFKNSSLFSSKMVMFPPCFHFRFLRIIVFFLREWFFPIFSTSTPSTATPNSTPPSVLSSPTATTVAFPDSSILSRDKIGPALPSTDGAAEFLPVLPAPETSPDYRSRYRRRSTYRVRPAIACRRRDGAKASGCKHSEVKARQKWNDPE
ncbi:uncharacterized protein LOC122015816 isoform X2 [Zingiber officinale]|uniref:Uncharacterized protein n=1 Tax=Zingiber officinale TaxID=94328 RepID=A0A8J5F8K8_ZINOF|nr:uncharacterized protein LOC122015816 isoform X2 [Zingiber officinale]KAG6482092.1 hypothetical protein ZIOFF_058719 [Zingiber officinale]